MRLCDFNIAKGHGLSARAYGKHGPHFEISRVLERGQREEMSLAAETMEMEKDERQFERVIGLVLRRRVEEHRAIYLSAVIAAAALAHLEKAFGKSVRWIPSRSDRRIGRSHLAISGDRKRTAVAPSDDIQLSVSPF